MRRLLLLASLPFLLPSALARAAEVVDGVAAQVGNEIVLVSEITQYTDPVEKQLREAGAGDADVIRMKSEVLERLIQESIAEALREIEAAEQGVRTGLAPDTRFVLNRAALAAGNRAPDETEAAVLELAAGNVTLRRILDWLPESDARIEAAVAGLLERRVLSERPR